MPPSGNRAAEQPELPGFELDESAASAFLAIIPAEDAGARIEALQRRMRSLHRLTGQLLPAERIYSSVYAIGDWPDSPQSLRDKVATVAESIDFPPIELYFDSVLSFSGPSTAHPLVLRAGRDAGIAREFHASIAKAMKGAGIGAGPDPLYVPHIALLHDDTIVEERPIEPVRWTAREFVLMHRPPGQSRSMILGRWPLLG